MPDLMTLAEPYSGQSLSTEFRRALFGFFRGLIAGIPRESGRPLEILDVGGVEDYWETNVFVDQANFTILNLDAPAPHHANVTTLAGDARDLSRWADKSFDLVVSNSVIEHVGTVDDQQVMADEVRRVGKRYFVQTPNFWFPVEPHAVFPVFHWLPEPMRASLLQSFRLGHLYPRPEREEALDLVRSIRIVSARELKSMFPDGTLWREKLSGLTKSLTIYRM